MEEAKFDGLLNLEDANFEVLINLGYKDIINAGKASSKFFRICRKPYFWERKALVDFGISREAFKDISGRDNKARYEYLMKVTRDNGLINACEIGSLELTKYFISRDSSVSHVSVLNIAIMYASYRGHIEIVKIMLSLGANDYNEAMRQASRWGHMDIVKLMLSKGANNYNEAMSMASLGGHKDIVELMLSLGANDYNEAMRQASRGGHMDIVKLMLSKGANNYNEAMSMASLGGHEKVIHYIREYINSCKV